MEIGWGYLISWGLWGGHRRRGPRARLPGGPVPRSGSLGRWELAFSREGLGWMFRLIVHAQRDKGRSRFGLSPFFSDLVPSNLSMSMEPCGYARAEFSREAESWTLRSLSGGIAAD